MWKHDLIRYNLSGKFKFFKALLIPGFKYTFIIRLIQSNSILKPFYKILWRFYSRWYGIQIQYNTTIGKGFYIGHFGTIVVNGNVKIGNNCNISQGVTIGATNRGGEKVSLILAMKYGLVPMPYL